VTEYACGYAPKNTDFFFSFTITYITPKLNVPLYSQYKKGYQSVRGNKFKGGHVHSIIKKKRMRDEKLEREYPEVRSDFRLEVVDKTLVNLF